MLRAIYLSYCMLRELNHRLTGVSREASPAATVLTTAVVAGALQSVLAPALRPFRRMFAGRPSAHGVFGAYATARYIADAAGGEPLREIPGAHALIALGFIRPLLQVLSLPATLARAAAAGVARSWRWLTTSAPGIGA